MKFFFITIAILSSSLIYSQVGVNTVKPQTIFHIDGAKDNPKSNTIPNASQQSNDFVVTAEGKVGIGTINPRSTIDITSKSSDSSVPDGVLIPRLTGDQLKAKENTYDVTHNGTLVYVTQSVTNASSKTAMVNEQGFYFYDSTQDKWRKLNTSVPLNIQAYNGQNIVTNSTSVAIGATRRLEFPVTNISPTVDIGSWSADFTTFTVNKKGVYTIYAGTAMENSSEQSTGAMTIHAGPYSFTGGSQRTVAGSVFSVNCSSVFSGLLNVGDQIYVIGTSGINSWKQGKSFLHIVYSEI